MKNKVRLVFALIPALAGVVLTGCEFPNPGPNPGPGPVEDPFATVPQDAWNIDDTGTIKYVRKNSIAAGYQAASDTQKYACEGTDLGFTWFDSELNRLYVTFGDSNEHWTPQRHGWGEWNSNVTLYTSNFNFENGVMWEGALDGQFGGKSRQITPVAGSPATTPGTTTTIPTGAFVLNGTYYLFYMEVNHFDDIHDTPTTTIHAVGMWDTFYTRCVKSTDKGATWKVVEGLEWLCHDENFNTYSGETFAQIHPLDIGDDYVYIYGIPGGRNGAMSMGRVLKTNFENIDEYEYWCGINSSTGQPVWRKGASGLSYIRTKSNCRVISGKIGEFSLCYNPYFQKYMMFYFSSQSTIVFRLMGANPWTWGKAISIAAQAQIPCLYGGASAPCMFDHDGKRMFMFIAQWSSTTYWTHLVEVVFN